MKNEINKENFNLEKAISAKRNTKILFRHIKQALKDQIPIDKIIGASGETQTEILKIANTFNSYFLSV